jgi:hypothetical protein
MSVVLALIAAYSSATIVVTIMLASFMHRAKGRADKALEQVPLVPSAKKEAARASAVRRRPGSKLSPAGG